MIVNCIPLLYTPHYIAPSKDCNYDANGIHPIVDVTDDSNGMQWAKFRPTQCSKPRSYSIESWLVKKKIPRSWIITIPNMMGSIIPELIISHYSVDDR